jgi:pilus assembly protein CpaB
MKSSRAVLVLALALISGIAAMFIGIKFLGGNNAPTSKLIVAAQDIRLGVSITKAMVAEVAWPGESRPAGSFSKIEDLVDRVAVASVVRGEPILETRLAAIGSKGGLSAAIPEGYRAITVKVNEVMGVAGFGLPGSFIDLMVNIRQSGDDGAISKIVLERIQVLAIAQDTSQDETKPRVVNAVTLQVTPDQAEKIDLARSVGSLSLVLRNQTDTAMAETAGNREEDLLTSKAQRTLVVPAKPEPPPVRTVAKVTPRVAPRVGASAPMEVQAPTRARVEIIRGVQRSEAEL